MFVYNLILLIAFCIIIRICLAKSAKMHSYYIVYKYMCTWRMIVIDNQTRNQNNLCLLPTTVAGKEAEAAMNAVSERHVLGRKKSGPFNILYVKLPTVLNFSVVYWISNYWIFNAHLLYLYWIQAFLEIWIKIHVISVKIKVKKWIDEIYYIYFIVQ